MPDMLVCAIVLSPALYRVIQPWQAKGAPLKWRNVRHTTSVCRHLTRKNKKTCWFVIGHGIRHATEYRQAGRWALPPRATLSGPVTVSVLTGADGRYKSWDLLLGTYSIKARQPSASLDGRETLGTAGVGDVRNDRSDDSRDTSSVSTTRATRGDYSSARSVEKKMSRESRRFGMTTSNPFSRISLPETTHVSPES